MFRRGGGDRLQILLLLQDVLPKERIRAVTARLPLAPARSPPRPRRERGGSGRVSFSLSVAAAELERKKSCRGAAAALGAAPGWALGAPPSSGPAASGTERTMLGRELLPGGERSGAGGGSARGGGSGGTKRTNSPEEREAAGGAARRGRRQPRPGRSSGGKGRVFISPGV